MDLVTAIQYIILFVITLFFTLLALTKHDPRDHPIILKTIASICWMVMAILQFLIGNSIDILTIAFSALCMMFAFLFALSGITDWFNGLKYGNRKMGEFE